MGVWSTFLGAKCPASLGKWAAFLPLHTLMAIGVPPMLRHGIWWGLLCLALPESVSPCARSIGVILATALGISVAAVALHGSLRTPDDLFTDEIEVRRQSLLLMPT